MSASAPPINRETVRALLDNVRELLRDEADRTGSLAGRAGGVTGFAGIILTLTGVAAKSGRSLHEPLRDAVAAMSAASLFFLALAVVIAVFGVLVPSGGTTIATTEIENYPTWARITQEAVMAEGTIMRGLIAALLVERKRNEYKAKALRFSYGSLFIGLALVTATGITLAAAGHFYV